MQRDLSQNSMLEISYDIDASLACQTEPMMTVWFVFIQWYQFNNDKWFV